MGRPRKPHFRESDQYWVSMFRGRRFKLARGRENEAAARHRFHELMALEAVVPAAGIPECDRRLGFRGVPGLVAPAR